jgi:hypothetical protein
LSAPIISIASAPRKMIEEGPTAYRRKNLQRLRQHPAQTSTETTSEVDDIEVRERH